MTIKVRCEQCGKVSQFSPSDAGMVALCVACGARFTVPAQANEDVIPDRELLDGSFFPGLAAAKLSSSSSSAAAENASKSADANAQVAVAARPRGGGSRHPRLDALLGTAITLAVVLGSVFLP